jgi:DNA repair exonuclease SbcCD ATPase subunit
MINKVAHLADIHIRKSIARHQEYRTVFNNLITQLKVDKPDRIVIVGDLFHDYIKLEGELLVLASEFMNDLSEIAPVIITRGNHDIARSAPNRTDTIDALVKTMRNDKIKYFNKTGMYEDENIVWAVWKHGDKRNNPWTKAFVKDTTKTYIDLFHDPVNGSRNSDGHEFNSKTYHSITEFMGEISMFGDIHMLQYLDTAKTKAYSSSLIEQNFGEGEQFHGYLLWDVATRNATEVPISNSFGHFTIDLNRFTDFDKLQLNINTTVPNKRIRIKWKTLPAVKNIENMRKVDTELINKYAPLSIKHINDFIEEKKITIEDKEDIENIGKRETVHKIITEYLTKMGTKPEIIQDILDLDVEIENRLTLEELTNIQWSILKLNGKNFRSYEDIEINWENQDGLYQIVGENGVGKSTINQLITYILFGKSLETDFRKKFGDSRFINNKLLTNSCEGSIILEANGEYYGIKRQTVTKKNKEGELTAASTTASYYKLTSPTDVLDDQFNIEKLNEQDRFKTQDRINEIIGTYENFIRVTLTTSDTLNSVLSSDKAPFIDSLLYDSGLDIFDVRSKEFKKYKEELIIDKALANVNVPQLEGNIKAYHEDINLKQVMIMTAKEKITSFRKELDLINVQKDTLQQSMHQIDSELFQLNDKSVEKEIIRLENEADANAKEKQKIEVDIERLKDVYFDAVMYEDLTNKRDNHKNVEFEKRTAINKRRMEIEQLRNTITRINGDIELLKKEGGAYKKEIQALEQSKTCTACGQTIEKDEHKEHIKKTVAEKEKLMFGVVDKIRAKELEKPALDKMIQDITADIADIEKMIQQDSLEISKALENIGSLTNYKMDVEKRERLKLSLTQYDLQQDNFRLKIEKHKDTLKRYNDQKINIEKNKEISAEIALFNQKINYASTEIDKVMFSISEMENSIKSHKHQILNIEKAIKDYLDFERKEQVRLLYGETIHRDGLPTQILTDKLLPKINNVLSKLLETADFDVYLDKDDLRLKFFYNNHSNAIIDCISASGMERTFAVYALKIALNQINSKSKSTLLTVDEVMGKLKGEYVDKFVDLLHLSKKFYKKVLIIEPTHEVNPDYLLQIEKDSNHISKLILN